MEFPKRAPELNPMDTLRDYCREVITASKQVVTLEDQSGQYYDHLLSMSGFEALHTSSVLSDDF